MIRGWTTSSYGNLFAAGVGSLQADGNGNITQGNLETYSYVGPGDQPLAGTYCLASNNLGIITTAASPSRMLAFSLQSDGNGNIIFYDCCSEGGTEGDSNSGFEGAGILRRQQTTAFSTSEISGSYAFEFVGADGGAPRLAEAGVLTTDGNGNIISGEYDFNDGGNVATGTIIAGESFYSVASSGRGTATIVSTASGAVSLVFYVVNASEILFLQEDGAGSPVVAGQALLQTGPFTNASLSGNIVVEISEAQAGLITADGSGSFTFIMDAYGTETPYTGTGDYLVASNGRVALSNISGVFDCEGCNPPVFYLVSPNKAFIIGTTSEADRGGMVQQSGNLYTNASLNGSFNGGSEEPVGPAVGEEVDSVNFDGIGTITGTADQNGPESNGSYTPSSGPVNGTYAVASNGRVVVTNGVQETIIYIISTSEFVALTSGLANSSYNPYWLDFKH